MKGRELEHEKVGSEVTKNVVMQVFDVVQKLLKFVRENGNLNITAHGRRIGH